MTHKPHTLFFTIIFLLSAYNVIAVPPQSSVTSEIVSDALQIVTPKTEYIRSDVNTTIHIHVYNGTNHLITGSDRSLFSCYLHGYNTTGDHIVNAQMLLDGNGVDYYYVMDHDLLREPATYGFVISCNDSANQAGFNAFGIDYRYDYRHDTYNTGMVLAMIFGMAFVSFIILYFVNHLNTEYEDENGQVKTNRWNYIFKLAGILFFIGSLPIIAGLVNKLAYGTAFYAITLALYKLVTGFSILFFTLYLLYLIYSAFKTFNNLKEMRSKEW